MANYTDGLRLFKYDINEDADRPYDLNLCLNDNWEKLDEAYRELRTDVDNKQDSLVSGRNIKTINGQTIVGNGNLTIETSSISHILNVLYPVGAIYISTAATCPMQNLGIGSWRLIEEGCVLQNRSGNRVTGQVIEAGLPNIKGLMPASENLFKPFKAEKGSTYTTNIDNIKLEDKSLFKVKDIKGNYVSPSTYYGGKLSNGASNPSGCFTKIASNVVSGSSANDKFDNDLWSFEAHFSSSVYRDDVTTVQPKALTVNIWIRIN